MALLFLGSAQAFSNGGPSITATLVDAFTPNGNGKAEPGDTITNTATITNNGTDATDVEFGAALDPDTTLVLSDAFFYISQLENVFERGMSAPKPCPNFRDEMRRGG